MVYAYVYAMPKGFGSCWRPPRRNRQRNFRMELIIAQKAEHPSLWCQIIRYWVHKDIATAAHNFPWKQGQDTMTKIVGQEAEHEMFPLKMDY